MTSKSKCLESIVGIITPNSLEIIKKQLKQLNPNQAQPQELMGMVKVCYQQNCISCPSTRQVSAVTYCTNKQILEKFEKS